MLSCLQTKVLKIAKVSGQTIAKRKQTDEYNKQSEEKYRQLLNSMTTMFEAVKLSYFVVELIHDKNGKPVDVIYREVNPVIEQLTGKSKEQLIGKSRKELFGDVNDEFPQRFDGVAKTGKPAHFEIYGAALQKYYDVYAWRVGENQVGVILTDITKSKKTEEALKQSEERFSKAFGSNPVALSISQLADGRITDVNKAYLKLLGFSRQEVIGHTSTELNIFTSPTERSKLVNILREKSSVSNLDITLQTKTGKPVNAIISIDKINSKSQDYLVSTLVDITERKKAEETLLAKEHELASIYASVPEVLFFLSVKSDRDFRFLSVSQSFLHVTGLNEHQVVGKSVQEVIPEPSLSLVLEKYGQAIREHKTIRWEEVTDYPSGRKYGEVAVTPFFDSSRRCTNLIGSVYDITERKKAEEELKISEEKYRQLLQQAPAAIYEIDFAGPRFLSVNDGMCIMLGFSREELLAKNPNDFLVPESLARFKKRITKPFAGEKIDETVEYTTITKDGCELCITLNMKFLIKNGKVFGAQVVAHDITARMKAEKVLRYNETLLASFFDSPGMMRGIVEVIDDKDIRHIKDNMVTASYIGLTPADLEGKLSSELGEPTERIKIWIEHYKQSQETGKPVTWEYADSEGSKKTWLSPTRGYRVVKRAAPVLCRQPQQTPEDAVAFIEVTGRDSFTHAFINQRAAVAFLNFKQSPHIADSFYWPRYGLGKSF